MISCMSANDYQKELDSLLQDTEERAALRKRAITAERYQQFMMIV